MRASPIVGLALLIGAGVLGVCPVRSRPACEQAVATATSGRPTSNGICANWKRGGSNEASAASRNAVSSVVAVEKAEAPAPRRADPAPVEVRRYRTMRMLVTAYCTCEICCEKFSGAGRTSIGKNANVCDGVAADPKLLPYHTLLEIPSVGLREVDDTGGAMRQDAKRGIVHIDVRMASHSAARQWGVRWLEVKILK